MDYLSLFNGRDRIEGGPFTLVAHRRGGEVSDFFGQSEYLMIFCLQGAMKFSLTFRTVLLEAGGLVVIDKRSMRSCRCRPDTVLLKYATHGKLAAYMDDCSRAFDTPATTVIPIREPLAAWIESLARQLASGEPAGQADYTVRRRELAHLLLEYPRSELEELFIPLFACSRHCETAGQCVFDASDEGGGFCEKESSSV